MDTRTLEQQCENLALHLNLKAPALIPKIIPRNCNDDNFLLFAKTKQQQIELEQLKNTYSEKLQKCSICDQEDSFLQFSTSWTLDFTNKKYSFDKLQFLCPLCYNLRDLEYFITAAIKLEEHEEIDKLVKHFCKINKIPTTNNEIFNVQQIYCLAYSLKTLASNANLSVVFNENGTFTEETTFQSFFEHSFLEKKRKTPSEKTSGKTSGNSLLFFWKVA